MIPAMRKERKPSPTESPLPFEVDSQPIEETLTALGGIPLVVQAFRSLELPRSVREQVRVKERDRGYDEATLVESFVILNAAGGDCVDDFKRLRDDSGLAKLVGHELPSPPAALLFWRVPAGSAPSPIGRWRRSKRLWQLANQPGRLWMLDAKAGVTERRVLPICRSLVRTVSVPIGCSVWAATPSKHKP